MIIDDSKRICTIKKWDSSGNLIDSKVETEIQHWEIDGGSINPWKRIPEVYSPGEIESGQFFVTVSAEHLEFDEVKGRRSLHGRDYTGDVFCKNADGSVEFRSMVDGRWSMVAKKGVFSAGQFKGL